MSIADKLIYLNGTKDKLKDSINNIGGSITDETTFRAYATELDNIYSSLPKTTGEGSNLSLTTLKGRINVDDILGDTQQEGTPTPDTPIDINVVTGTQEVVVQNRNLFKEAPAFTPENINWKDNFGNLMGNVSAVKSSPNYYDLIGGQTYTFKIDSYANINNWQLVYITNNTLASVADKGTNVTDSKTFTPSTNMRVWYRNSNNNTTTQYYCKAQLELGSTASEWQPYQEQTKTLHLGDIELCKIGTYQDRISKSSGKNLFDKDNANIIDNAYIGSTNIASINGAKTLYIECEPNTTYTISRTAGKRFVVATTIYEPQLNTSIGGRIVDNEASSITITTNSVAKYLCVFYYLSGTDTLSEETIRNSIMINEGSTALPYEPYGTNWYIEKNIGKKVLNGSENWTIQKTGTPNWFYALTDSGIDIITDSTTNNSMCDHYTWGSVGNSNTNTGYYIVKSGSVIRIRYGTEDTIANYKTWLASHNTLIYYVMETPTYEEITNTTLIEELNEIEKMMSYNGQTNISVSGNLPMILGVTALKGE